MDPLIIEVRGNEFADRGSNPKIPYGAEAIIEDALNCAEAGAVGYHWHARGLDGLDRPEDVRLHAEVIEQLQSRSDLILHPTLGFTSTQGNAVQRLATIDQLLGQGLRPDIVPVDFGAMIADVYDAEHARFRSEDAVLLNRTGYLRELITAINERGLAILAVVWSPGGVRTALRLLHDHAVTVPVYWQLGFTGPSVPGGPPGTRRQLEAYLDELPPHQAWNVHVRDGDGLPMATEAILRGGHVAIGLGDDPYERLGLPSNADLVARLSYVARTIGRELATPELARQMLGMPARSNP